MGPTGGVLFSCRQSEENLTGEQAGPDVIPPYAAYAPPGTPQVGLEHPLPSSLWLHPNFSLPDPGPLHAHSIATPLAHHLVILQTLMAPT